MRQRGPKERTAGRALLEDPRVSELISALVERGRGFPSGGKESFEGDAAALCRALAGDFARCLGAGDLGLGEISQRIEEAGSTAGEALASLMTGGAPSVESLAARLDVDPGAFSVFATYWVRPFARSGAASPASTASWTGARANEPCPSCGGQPSLARLNRLDGARFLWCAACDVEWRGRALGCPFCGNEEAETLGCFEVEGEGRLRVDACERCHGYLKVIDERRTPGAQPADYDAYLWSSGLYDVIAAERGLSPGGTPPAPVAARTEGMGEGEA